ncbi:MAG TPA: rhodanese-like domain-containing protein [Vicinamibacterales bacterium]|nr:rhodanese-like domain-containing protein [Vicinamibacterales bacterium]
MSVVKHVSVTEARELQEQGHVYVDVRSSEEYAFGHPEGAFNVPLLDRDPVTGQMAPNPDFVRVMQAAFPPETKLLIGCQVGGRSSRAAHMLASFGFGDVSNVRGGFGGMRDQMSGRVVDPGWHESGLPVEEGQPAQRRYETLVEKADGPA